jgi:hypothetical protein
MTESIGYQHWLHVVPENGRVHQEIEDGQWIVWCTAPEEPPPPDPPPNAAGSLAGQLDDNTYYSLDWELVDGELVVHDLDVTLSLDDEAG